MTDALKAAREVLVWHENGPRTAQQLKEAKQSGKHGPTKEELAYGLRTALAEVDKLEVEIAEQNAEAQLHCGCEFEDDKLRVTCGYHLPIASERDKLRAEVERLTEDNQKDKMKALLYRAYNSPEPQNRQAAFKDAMARADLAEAEVQRLTTRLKEMEEHERHTHEQLGAILGTDDSLEQCALRLTEALRAKDVEIAEAIALVLSHEGRIDRLTAERERLETWADEAAVVLSGAWYDLEKASPDEGSRFHNRILTIETCLNNKPRKP